MSQTDDFLTQIESLPALITDCVPLMEPLTRKILSTPEIYGLRQIILTGSGDSFFAAAAVIPALRAWTGIPVQAMTSMEAARYVDNSILPDSSNARGLLVISISYSGEAARGVEAAQRLRKMGAITIGFTANPDSRLGKAVERQVSTLIPNSAPAPGTRSYVASMIATYLLAIRISEVLMCMTMDEANRLRAEIQDSGAKLENLVTELAPKLRKYAETWSNATSMDVLGSGPSLATASYCAAKLVEAGGIHASPQDIEEFHHLNFFVNEPSSIPTIVFSPSNSASASRASELVIALQQLGRPTLFITDEDNSFACDNSILIPKFPEWLSPLAQTIPAAIIAAFSANIRNVTHYRGHDGPWRGAKDAGFVKNSTIILKQQEETNA